MNTLNGKLLGQAKSDSEIFKQQLENLNRELDEVQASWREFGQKIEQSEESKREALVRRVEVYIQHLKARCENLETVWTQRQENQAKTYQGELKKMELLAIEQQKRLTALETTKLNQIEKKIIALQKQIPTKLLWLTLSSSLMMTTISVCTWFDIYPFNNRPHQKKYSLDRQELILHHQQVKCQSNCFKYIPKI